MMRMALVVGCLGLGLGLGLGCGGEKKQKEQPAPAPVEPTTRAKPTQDGPRVLTIEVIDRAAAAAVRDAGAPASPSAVPYAALQASFDAAKDELEACFSSTEATKANVSLVVTANAGTIESVTPSADRERAEECLRKTIGVMGMPTWQADSVELLVKLRYEPAPAE